jgi:hypothetical protein
MSKIRSEKERWEVKKGITFPHWTMDRSRWVVFEDAHLPLVGKETWLSANAVRKIAHKPGSARSRTPYLLSAL